MQKGLTRKGGHKPFPDPWADLAELMDLLGRAVVLRDAQGVARTKVSCGGRWRELFLKFRDVIEFD